MPKTLTVRADQPWIDTGFPRPRNPDYFVMVQADGSWTFRPNGSDWTVGPRGGNKASDYCRVDGQESYPFHGPGAVKGALIGKWGKDGETFVVGEFYTERGMDNDPLKGRTLFLGINDDYHENNSGSLNVVVDERKRAGDVQSPTYHYDPANGWVQD